MYSTLRTNTSVKAKGFSLLEVLVVLVIIAFSVNLITYTVSDSDEEELESMAMRMQGTINLASEFAVLNQVELGFHLDKGMLEFLVFDGEKWRPFEADDIYKPIEPPEQYKIDLILEDLPWSQDNLLEQANWRELMSGGDDDSLLELKKLKIPQVLILSSGEVSAFRLSVENKELPEPIFYVEGEFMAPVSLKREPEL
ncbi:prepilin-type N-terminal cleavage/methylation domain-containing protein [Pseudoalteromonas piscicida]|uniref:Type II secretion system protein GspH n=1 Tax=Pseudoalteromonas piscicida TaxID=43662 RepID=A0A2A5JKK9_PSEO7|nr:prepilin-type N-terminal cleavage/methylation domain-containing protein [Pseudoalteromonas piscicida]PCK29974.1 type II secretion system protein GspH [Pseudoalteromonas piscicida]